MTDLPLEESCPRSAKEEEPSCSYSAPHSETSSDVKIKRKINDLNQTFVRIINSLKIMNVHNRNSGRESLNSNDEMLSLFDDFLNISHLLNIKINYLYNTYAPRSEIKKYISPINYKLYVFNINSFELSQEIDKGNRKHKKYQILHDLNISEMTNNVKLFNFVDDVEVEEPTSSKRNDRQDQAAKGQENIINEQDTDGILRENMIEGTSGMSDSVHPCSEPFSTNEPSVSYDDLAKDFTKKLKRKPESHCMSPNNIDNTSLGDNESTAEVDSSTKKLKTAEENADESDSVDMYNNLFKEINSNILKLSKDIDELNTLLRNLTLRQEVSPGCSSNEENSDEERDEMKKQSAVDKKLKKWQMKQMTRALIDNMVNSIQEEYVSRNEARHERSLVNEAVLMAIQRFGLQQQQHEESSGSREETVSDGSAGALGSRARCDDLPPGALVSRSIVENLVGQCERESPETDHNPAHSFRPAQSSSLYAGPSNTTLPDRQQTSKVARLNLNGADSNDELDDSDSLEDLNERVRLSEEKDDLQENRRSKVNELQGTSESSNSGLSSSTSMTSSTTPGEKITSSIEESVDVTSSSDNYYDDDFLAQAVTVAISKKGLST